MFRWFTAGESHGQGLVIIVEGIPAGLEVDEEFIGVQLARRQKGYGRGGRMLIEQDWAHIETGIRHGKTMGSPIALTIKNKAKAMALLVAKLKQNEIDEQQNTIASERKILVGTGDRSEKIRTYNFPQGRITDHRIKLTQHNLDQVMDGDMISICQALVTENQLAQLSNLEETS